MGGWKLKDAKNIETGQKETQEIFEEKEYIETVDHEKYLGDIVQTNGKHTKNILNRENRGISATNQIMQILESIYFGKYQFEAAITLRNSLLIGSMLCNSEAWYNVTIAEMEKLEKIDEKCIRKLLMAPYGTPKVMLYLECGLLPIRFIIQSRRLNFLQYILKEEKSSLINQFLQAQLMSPTNGDWGSLVKKDISDLEMNITLKEIEDMSKGAFKKLVKDKVKNSALKYLEGKKGSKSQDAKHQELTLQEYLAANNVETSVEVKQFAFQCRSRMLQLKTNMKNNHDEVLCSACGLCDETQLHLMQCKVINENDNENTHENDHEGIYSTDINAMFRVTKAMKHRMKILKRIVQKAEKETNKE